MVTGTVEVCDVNSDEERSEVLLETTEVISEDIPIQVNISLPLLFEVIYYRF